MSTLSVLCGRQCGLTVSVSMRVAVFVSVAVSMSVAVSVSAFHVSHKLLHHKEGDNPTENPQPH